MNATRRNHRAGQGTLRVPPSWSILLHMAPAVAACATLSARAYTLPDGYPVLPGQRGTVQCLEFPGHSYDIYLPTTYSLANELPMLITFNPGGGGYVGTFQSLGEELGVIVVGNTVSRNYLERSVWDASVHAMMLDLRHRVNYDPTAVFAAGLSGGGVTSFRLAQAYFPEIAGVLSMGGWLMDYQMVIRYMDGLLVARTAGNTDHAVLDYNYHDQRRLWSAYNVEVQDWYFTGGHTLAPANVRRECLLWLLNARLRAGRNARDAAAQRGAGWRTRIAQGERAPVFKECLQAVLHRPRTHDAREAQMVLDDLLGDFATLRGCDLTGLPRGEWTATYFRYMGMMAAHAGDTDRFHSSAYALACVEDQTGTIAPEFAVFADGQGIPFHTLVASSGAHGSIAPSGSICVDRGTAQAFTITADPWYGIADVRVDGSSVGAVASHTLHNVTSNHVVVASFDALLAPRGTPKHWLARFGWTDDFAAAELADSDGDGAINAEEYVADTDPTDPDSVLKLIRIAPQVEGVRIDWQGGVRATQYVEWSPHVDGGSEGWTTLFINQPPTQISNTLTVVEEPGPSMFFRIRVE